MSTRRPFTLFAAAIFALMALVHIYRIATNFQIIVGSHTISMTVSWLAIVVAGVLAVLLYRESQT